MGDIIYLLIYQNEYFVVGVDVMYNYFHVHAVHVHDHANLCNLLYTQITKYVEKMEIINIIMVMKNDC